MLAGPRARSPVFYLRSAVRGRVRQVRCGPCRHRRRWTPAEWLAPRKGFDRPRFLLCCSALCVGMLLLVPLALVVIFSFNAPPLAGALHGLQPPAGTERFFDNDPRRESLIASIEIALVTMVVSTVPGTLLAFGLVRARTRWAGCAQRANAAAAGHARDRHRGLRAAAVHAARVAALPEHDHPRPHHVLDLVRDGGRARPAGAAQPRGRGGGAWISARPLGRSGS